MLRNRSGITPDSCDAQSQLQKRPRDPGLIAKNFSQYSTATRADPGISAPISITICPFNYVPSCNTPCACMGSNYGLIGVGSATMDRVMGGIVVVFLSGSGYLIWHKRYRPERRTRVVRGTESNAGGS